MKHAMEHCDRPWWKRPPFWFIAIAAVIVLAVFAIEQINRRPAMPYSVFLEQIEAGNVASVSFQGTELTGRLKQGDSFRSRVPDFGDPTLIPELRKQHVAIDVTSPSAWGWLLGRVPWPMLIVLGALLVAGLVRMLRGGKALPGSAAATLPAHGMMGLVSGLFAKPQPPASPPPHDGDESKTAEVK